MNYPVRVFRDLSSAWQQDAADERVDRLAAELTACARRARHALSRADPHRSGT